MRHLLCRHTKGGQASAMPTRPISFLHDPYQNPTRFERDSNSRYRRGPILLLFRPEDFRPHVLRSGEKGGSENEFTTRRPPTGTEVRQKNVQIPASKRDPAGLRRI
jgi:hypothetical protein